MLAFLLGQRDRSLDPGNKWWDEGPVPVSQASQTLMPKLTMLVGLLGLGLVVVWPVFS